MILLPLGPKGKLPDFPLMSIAIGVVTIAFSIFCFRQLDQAITRTMKHEGYRMSREAAEKLTSEWCERETVSATDCVPLKQKLSGFELLSQKNYLAKVDPKIKSTAIKLAEEVFPKLQMLPEWQSWQAYVSQTYAQGNWLSKKTISAVTLLKSQLTHGGWIHLLGNMIFFFAFAGALEMRLGMFAWLTLYLIGGTTGLLFESTTALPDGVPLIGASAGISALAGAYLVFFWKHPTRVLFSMIIYNRVILIPTFAFVLVMLVSQDIAGSLGEIGSTAHLAHLSGLIFGVVFAIMHRFFVHREMPFLYPHEQELFDEAQDSKEALAIYDQILLWNPENKIVRDLAFAEANKDLVPSAARIKFYSFHFAETLTQLRRDKDYDRIVNLCRDLSQTVDFTKILLLLNGEQRAFVSRLLNDLNEVELLESWKGALSA